MTTWIVAGGAVLVLLAVYVGLYEYPRYRRIVKNPRPGYLPRRPR